MRTQVIFLLAFLIGCTYAQMAMNPMALMMMKGGGGFFGKFLNNPYTLCKMTENVKAVPCSMMPHMCMIQSMKNYKLPNLMKCSPMGVGCCLKDARSLAMAKVFSRRR